MKELTQITNEEAQKLVSEGKLRRLGEASELYYESEYVDLTSLRREKAPEDAINYTYSSERLTSRCEMSMKDGHLYGYTFTYYGK